MKRAITLVTALVIAAGAFAPAASAFADDYIPDHIPLTDIYADPTLYDLYVSPYYNDLTFAEWGDYATDAVISGFPMDTVKQVEATEGGLESLWNVVHDAFSFGYNIGQDWVSKFYVDTSDGRLKSVGNIMTDDLKALLNQYFKTSGDLPSQFEINGHIWLSVPFLNSGSTIIGFSNGTNFNNRVVGYVTRCGNQGAFASYNPTSSTSTVYYLISSNSHSGRCEGSYTYDGVTYRAGTDATGRYPSSISSQYSTVNLALSDFYSHGLPSGDPTWNGDGYYRDEYIVDVALPALPAIDWQDLNNNYYTEYGGDFVEGDVNNFYYDISYDYYPAEYTYTIPYWLIDGNTSILDFNYTLELPTAELSTLPEDFEGGSNFWNSSFGMVGGFGAFILLGLSFALVSLFFND